MAEDSTAGVDSNLSQYTQYELQLARGLMMTRAGLVHVEAVPLKPKTSHAFSTAAKPKTEAELLREYRIRALKEADYEGGYTKRGGTYNDHQLTAEEFRDYADGKKTPLPGDAAVLFQKHVAEMKKYKVAKETRTDAVQAAAFTTVNDVTPSTEPVEKHEPDGRIVTTFPDGRTITRFPSNALVLRAANGEVQRVTRPNEGGPLKFTEDSIVTKHVGFAGTVTYSSPNGMRVTDYTTESPSGWSSVVDTKTRQMDGSDLMVGHEIRKWGKQPEAQVAAAPAAKKAEPAKVAEAPKKEPWHDPREDEYDRAVEKLIRSAEKLRRPGHGLGLSRAVALDTGPAEPQALHGKPVNGVYTEEQKKLILERLTKETEQRHEQLKELMASRNLPTPAPMPMAEAPKKSNVKPSIM